MKKAIYILLAATAALFVSCAKEVNYINTKEQAKIGKTITFTASMEMPFETRATLSGLNINWQSGEYIGIATDNNATIVAYPITPDGGDPTKCTITVDAVDGATAYYALYKGDIADGGDPSHNVAADDFSGITFNTETKTFSGLTVGKQQVAAGSLSSKNLYYAYGYPLAMAGKSSGTTLSLSPCLALIKLRIHEDSVPADAFYKNIPYNSSYSVVHDHYYSAVRGFDFYQKGASTIYSSGDYTVQVGNDGTLTTTVVDNATKREYRDIAKSAKLSTGTDYIMCVIPGGSVSSFKIEFLGWSDNTPTVSYDAIYTMTKGGIVSVNPGDCYDLGTLNPLGRKKAKNEAEDEVADELAAFSPKITIDGTFSDWSAISAIASSYAGVSEWKVACDAYYLYMYFKVDKTIIGSGSWGSYFYTGLDLDNDTSNGDGHHGTGGGNEAMIGVFPFTGNDPVGFKTGTDPNGGVEYPVNTSTGVKVTTNGVVDGDYALVETSIPRSSIGNPANGLTIVFSSAMNYNLIGKQSLVLSN